jgi:glycosyltransferase involved in cell wall biosynthesis
VKISAVIIAFNEQSKIADAVKSLSWADEVLLVDSESTDDTRRIAANLGAKVVIQSWLGFSKQKQFAADSAVNDWIFSLDADERVSNELKSEIIALRSIANSADGYKIPRLSYYMGRPIRHGGWYPDRQLRLFDRRKGRWNERLVHESIEMNENTVVKSLKGEILHFSIDSARHHHRMIGDRYAPLAAKQMFENGKRTSKTHVMTAGLLAFIRSYCLQLGFLDGFPGFCIARFAAHHAFLKHLMLWDLQRGQNGDK